MATKLINVQFEDGSLGVTLRRNAEGIVYVAGIVEGTQAEHLDILENDELWSIGDSAIEGCPLDKDAWGGLVNYIKVASRPLKATWLRKLASRGAEQGDQDELRHTRKAGASDTSPVSSPPSQLPQYHHDVDSERDEDEEEEEEDDEDDEEEVTIDLNAVNALVAEVTDPRSTTSSSSSSGSRGLTASPPAQDAECDPELVELASRLVIKDKDGGGAGGVASVFSSLTRRRPAANDATAAATFVKEGRRVLKTGELTTVSRGALALFNAHAKVYFFLLTDILIVASAGSAKKGTYVVEEVIDLQVCKLSVVDEDASDAGGAFQVLSPAGTLQVSARSGVERAAWVDAILEAVCALKAKEVGSADRAVGWRHQFVTGTLHAAVIARDDAKLRELLARADDGAVDAADNEGYSPLHYACMYRTASAVRLLRAAGADVAKRDEHGFTPLHWAAMQLDADAIEVLCDGCKGEDVDYLDDAGRTPLFLACVEGRDSAGRTDPTALALCVSALLQYDADANAAADGAAAGSGWHLVHYLAASWQHEALEFLLEHGANVLAFGVDGGMNALHLAADGTPLKRGRGEGHRLMAGIHAEDDDAPEDLSREDGVPTLRALLRAGARPNVRDAHGRTPLQLVVEAEAVWGDRVGYALELLLGCGARLLDEGTAWAAYVKASPDVSVDKALQEWAAGAAVDADDLDMAKTPLGDFQDGENKPLGGAPEAGKTAASGRERARSSLSPKEKDAQAGKYCWLCAFQFTLFKRQHHCRLCDASCCDECGKKKAVVDGKEVRCCDACYNYLSSQTEQHQRRMAIKKKWQKAKDKAAATAAASSRASRVEPGPSAARRDTKADLLGVFGIRSGEDDSNKVRGAAGGAAATMAAMSEAHMRLQERGEKLSRLTDKSGEVANAASEFSKMAKKLNEQSRNSWF